MCQGHIHNIQISPFPLKVSNIPFNEETEAETLKSLFKVHASYAYFLEEIYSPYQLLQDIITVRCLYFFNPLPSTSTNKLIIQAFLSSWLHDLLTPFSSSPLTAKLLGMVLYTASHTGILAGYLRNPDDMTFVECNFFFIYKKVF